MKNQIKNVFYCIFFSIVMISGFFHYTQLESYSPEAPFHIGSNIEPFKEYGVHISAKAYNAEESKRYLKRNLIGNGLQPIQLTIQNNTASSLYLSTESIDLDGLSASLVANRIHRGYIPRSIGFKVASIFFWPFMIPSAIDSIVTFHHHKAMKSDYAAKSLKDEGETLIPYSTTHRIVFVKAEQAHDELTLYLHDIQLRRDYTIPTKIHLS